ncbi:ribonuclease H-like domain-containing protein [Tanacetum coccineum]
MTGSDNPLLQTPLSEKLSLVTHHYLLTRVPFKLDLNNWNFGSWEFFFEELCASYEVDKYLCSPINDTSASSLAPLTPEEIKVDTIVLSWILFTLSDSLRVRIVVAHPKSAKEAWSLIFDIVKDNKRSRTNTLKAELCSIKLGDQSMESYFQKIDSIVNILTSLDTRVNEEDVVHYALEGLLDTYNQVCSYMHWKDTFIDLKAVRSLLIAEEMRLKSKVLALPMDSSSPMVLVVETSTNSRSSTSQGKSWKPCFNFAKGSCRFGDSCRYVHDANARVSNANSGINKIREISDNTTNDLLTKLLAQLGHLGMNVAMSNNGTNVTLPNQVTVTPTVTGPNIAYNVPTAPHAFYASPVNYVSQAMQPTGSLVMGSVLSSGAVNTSGQATLLPQAFTAGTLHDPTTGAWNIDTGAYGYRDSIHVTNTGHSILSTPLKSLRLNDVLITPHIVKILIYVRQFVCDNDCTIEFDSFGFTVKDFMTRRVLF